MTQVLLIPVLISVLIGTAHAGFGARINNQIGRTVSNSIAKNVADNYIKPQLKITNPSGSVRAMALDAEKRLLAFYLDDGSVRVWDLALGIQRPTIQAGKSPYTVLAVDADRQLLFAGLGNGQVQVFDILTANPLNKIAVSQGQAVTSLALNSNKLLLAATSDNVLLAFDTVKNQPVWNTHSEHSITALAALNRFAVAALDNRQILIRDISNGKVLQSVQPVDDRVINLLADESSKYFYIGYENGELLLLSPETGKVLKQYRLIGAMQTFDVGSSGLAAAYSSDDHLSMVKNLASNTQVSLQTDASEIRFMTFNKQQNKVFALDQQGGIYVYDAQTGVRDLQIISTIQGWTVLDRNGRFDSSEPGLANIAWGLAGVDVPLDRFSENYYEPGLLAGYLNNSQNYFNQNPAVVQDRVTLPPLVNLTLMQPVSPGNTATIKITATGRQGGVERIAVFHNGKALPISERQINTETQDGITVKQLELEFTPMHGQNILEALASNTMGIESEKASESFFASVPDAVTAPVTLRVVAVGVNNYADPRLNLDYIVADAHSVAEMLKNKKFVGIHEVETQTLYNKEASKKAILSAINDAGQHQNQDILAIYLAGHGLVIDSEWYFLPYETTLHAEPEYYPQVGLSGQELKDVLITAKAQKIIMFIDSCYSGAGLDAFNYLINAQRYVGRNISRTVGIVVLTSARKDQEAAELSDLGHGLFTYYLTQGMSGKADENPVDKKITAYEVVDFPKQHIPELSKKYVGSSQDPMVFKMGFDFDLLQK